MMSERRKRKKNPDSPSEERVHAGPRKTKSWWWVLGASQQTG